MAKKVSAVVKIQIEGGKATPAPPVGTALGPKGIDIAGFCKQFNDATRERAGEVVPVVLTIYEDRSFNFILKTPPVAFLIKKAAGIEKGSGNVPRKKAGEISKAQLREIAEKKKEYLSADNIERAEKIIEGTAKSMGVEIK